MEIAGCVAIITGAGSGMGAATARYLHERGAKVALLDEQITRIEAEADALKGLAVLCDVSDARSAELAVKRVVDTWGSVAICLNCAGIGPAARIVRRTGAMPLSDFERVIRVNLIGTFNLLRLCAAQMVQQEPMNEEGERGVIINTASIA